MKVVLADDHRMMRDGLRALLERAGVTVVGEAANGREAIAEAKRLHPEILVIDIAMPELNGIDATRRLTAKIPDVKVIALSMNFDRRYVIAMLEAGAAGYLLKNAASDELLIALGTVARGQTYLSPAIAGVVVDEAIGRAQSTHKAVERPLTGREREVLQLIAEGSSSKEIAAGLRLSVPTVETHRRHLMEKLDLHSVAELTKYAIREGLTTA